MPKIIASTYEIVQEIGAGGGGVVYLGRHLRLGKWVVLKADKRTLATEPEVLRREVDALKNLSHTYIPQVYDFVVEDSTVYTVMDYIEGESLDKPLKRGERFEQARVIEWACQLLEALCYLHGRPPHGILHGDIKPANIMLTPQGNICLIDFNIALALGEKGAVRVGFSRGYASPEHYGLDYIGGSQTEEAHSCAETQVTDGSPETVVSHATARGSSSASGKRTVLLDVRSDIYSLGATLYHLFTGVRPAQDASAVQPIPRDVVSPAVAEIVAKAMAVDPTERFQSAAEMLRAFEGLHENDPRTKRHKRRSAVTAAVLSLTFLMGGASALVGLRQMERTQNAYALAEYSANALRAGDVQGALAYALEALPEKRGLLDPPYTAQAQLALANALGVYDMRDGFKAHRLIELPSEALKIAASETGRRAAILTLGELNVFDLESGALLVTRPMEASAMADALFAGEDTILYAGADGLCAYDIKAEKTLWTGEAATCLALSEDGATVAALGRDRAQAFVYKVTTGELLSTVDFGGKQAYTAVNDSFADPEDNLFRLSGDGRYLAVSFSDGALWVYDLAERGNDIEIYDASHYTHFEGGFFKQYFAFASTAENDSAFAVVDMERAEQTGGFKGTLPFHTKSDESGIYVATENVLVRLDPLTGEQTEKAYTDADITAFERDDAHTLVVTDDGSFSIFGRSAELIEKYTDEEQSCDLAVLSGEFAIIAGRDSPFVRLMKLENNSDAQILSYDPSFLHDESRVSADGETVMLFRYDCFRIYGTDGTLLSETMLPDGERVYDQQYRREEGCLEVIYYDGLIRRYSVESGVLLSETRGEAPDDSLYEEFYTERLKITSPLHGTPTAYDRESGALIRELEPDAYLAYVTQVGEYVITEYISAQGERYGLLLDRNCETLAELPELCDVLADGTLIFDDKAGNLRQGHIYSLDALRALAKERT